MRDERLTLSVKEAAQLLGISLPAAYQGVHSGQIPVLEIGSRLLVPRIQLERLLQGKSLIE